MKYTKLATAIAVGMVSTYASAAGFQLLEQNVSGLGNAYAGSAAVADNASTIFFNPAGMTQLKDREFSGGLAVIAPSFKFSDNGSSVGRLAGTGNGGDAGQTGYVPNAYMSWAINKDLYVGAGFSAPFGLKTEYSSPWLGAAQAVSFDVKTYNFNPSVAYRVNDMVSVGAGVSWQRLEAVYKRVVGVGVAGVPGAATAVFPASPLTASISGESTGWNAGVLFNVSPETKVGASYRSTVNYNLTGDITVTGPSSVLNTAGTSGAKASLTLPDTFIVSGTRQLSKQWEILGDVAYTGWSSIPKLDLVRSSGVIAQTLDTDFRDTWRVAVGANYRYSDAMVLKFGFALDQTPVKGASTRLVSLPDNDRTQISTGAQWKLANGSTLDLGLSYLFIDRASIDNNQSSATQAANRGRVTGSYDGSAWIVGAQYSVPF
ncbi:long-chain fatty acid transporter [Rhodoferax lacus]|uniref:Long-chain fatty acid transporter n=2 Tax=Rhodoferax lacus TaxID=2184758 RepID=A0A3E1RA92_9BURK|nr:long-chain fatty acid transporter [Rhodoferax lacus]